MADAATITVSATMLPDEIATTLSGSMTVTPDDAVSVRSEHIDGRWCGTVF